jgi:hypothetical protein
LTLSLAANCLGWTEAHNVASRLAALLAPAPFPSSAPWCAFGIYPDRMNDWQIAQYSYGRWATWLLVREAAEAFRDSDNARGCFLASVASHFAQDALSMSHSPIFTMGPRDRDANLLPPVLRTRLGRLPLKLQTRVIRRYGTGRQEEMAARPFFEGLRPPELLPELFQAVWGYAHDYLEGTAAALALDGERRRKILGADNLGDVKPWNAETLWSPLEGLDPTVRGWLQPASEGWGFYHRWLLAHYQGQWLLPFTLFEPKSLENHAPAFRAFAELVDVFRTEFRIAVETTVALYRYVLVASNTEIDAQWGPWSDEDPRLDSIGQAPVVIGLLEERPEWRRAAQFLAWEIAAGRERTLAGITGLAPIITIARQKDLQQESRYKDNHLILLGLNRVGSKHLLRVRPRPNRPDRLEIFLGARRAADMGNLMDVFLDEARAWLWGLGPSGAILPALEKIWAGAKLARQVKQLRLAPEELLAYVSPENGPIPFRNTEEDKTEMARLTQNARAVEETMLLKWLVASQPEKN